MTNPDDMLKACPFAVCAWTGDHELLVFGGLQSSRGSPKEFAAGCIDCDVFTPQFKTEAEAIAAWNSRIQPADDAVERNLRGIQQIAEEHTGISGTRSLQTAMYAIASGARAALAALAPQGEKAGG